MIRRCDRETVQVERQKDGTYSGEPHACKFPLCGCKQVGRLTIIVPELQRLAGVCVMTTSLHDIMELHANLSAAWMINGTLRGLPFILSRKPRMVSTPGKDGQRLRREKWLLSIEPAPAWVRGQIAALPSFDMTAQAQLPAPDPEPDVDEDGVMGNGKPEQRLSRDNGTDGDGVMGEPTKPAQQPASDGPTWTATEATTEPQPEPRKPMASLDMFTAKTLWTKAADAARAENKNEIVRRNTPNSKSTIEEIDHMTQIINGTLNVGPAGGK
jgi:hypothetical protein